MECIHLMWLIKLVSSLLQRRSSVESDQVFTQIKDNRGTSAVENRKMLDKQLVNADWPVRIFTLG